MNRRARVAAALPLVLCLGILVVVCVLEATLPLQEVGLEFAATGGWWTVVEGIVLSGSALVIWWRAPEQPLAPAMAGFGVFWALDGLAETYTRVGLSESDAWPGMTWVLWFLLRFTALLPVTVVLLLLLFPTGRFLPGRWGVAGRVGLVVMVLGVSVFLVVPAAGVQDLPTLPSSVDIDPMTIPGISGMTDVLVGIGRSVTILALFVPLATVVVRYRRSVGVDRDRMRWLLWGVIVMGAVITFWLLLGDTGPTGEIICLMIAFNVPVVAMALAVVNPDVVGIDELLSRTVVLTGTSLAVIAVDLLVLAGLTAFLDDRLDDQQVVLVVLLLSVLLYNPLRTRLAARVRRWVLGDRENPYHVVSGLAESLESASDDRDQLGTVASAVARAFGVAAVRVEVDRHAGERLVVSLGELPEETRVLPIAFRGAEVGRLVLPAKGVRARLSRADEALLGDLVRQAASVARSTQIADELQANREELVVSREEERRRIRRDLHDGLGPSLGGAVFQLDSARLLVDRDPAAAAAQLRRTEVHLRSVMDDVRRLVDDLRPPTLDERGLVGALEQVATSGSGPAVRVVAEPLPTLPAAVEVAAYRIVGEALTNVRRHAAAATCRVQLSVVGSTDAEGREAHLLVDISDDGIGIPAVRQAGVGHLSMRERAAELGGRLEVTCPPAGGTVVRAWLPLAHHPAPLEETLR